MATQKIETGLIADSAVTTAKLADNSVTAAKIAAGSLDDQVKGISSSADAVAITIDSSENVGIGTDSPDTLLHLNAVQAGAVLRLSRQDGSVVASDSFGKIEFYTTDVTNTGVAGYIDVQAEAGAAYGSMIFGTGTPGSADEKVRIASNGNVGIGTDSPTGKLEISATGTNAAPHIKLVESGDTREFNIYNDGSGNAHLVLADSDDDTPDTEIVLNDNGIITMLTGNSERMRIDSSGNLLVSKTANDNTTAGVVLRDTGEGSFVASGQRAGLFNRLSSDGEILNFRKDGTTVGSIGTKSSGLYIGTDDAGIFFNHHGGGNLDAVIPYDIGQSSFYNGHVDLGATGGKFKDLYLSSAVKVGAYATELLDGGLKFKFNGGAYIDQNTVGQNLFFRTSSSSSIDTTAVTIHSGGVAEIPAGVRIGGTAAANTLDDYEEGTWTPVYDGATSASGVTYTSRSGSYTKIGNTVTVSCNMVLSNKGTVVGVSRISGLPFAGNNSPAFHVIAPMFGNLDLDANQQGTGSQYAVNSFVYLFVTENDTGLAQMNNGQVNNNTDFHFTLTYMTNS